MKLLGNSDKSIQSTAITAVKVNAVITPPVAKSQSVTTNRDTSASITLDATDEDGELDLFANIFAQTRITELL
jgi:hypothetical protein